ncbi:hypothetical protein DICVIV_09229 [Dictyocaulus viviparus]|uniref:Uncharacterized protein n=1 Tax=Dictyocaulus viviparus TaxID=29172 RepID=A0A0D8XJK9_DICVI|nr:hypothetical protein DICVIV_09229 [Dictyocaulus viviparus]
MDQKNGDVYNSFTKSLVETATQTLDTSKSCGIYLVRNSRFGKGHNAQTYSCPISLNLPQWTNNQLLVNMENIGEREELYRVIENALDETIDRYSRLRTNAIIADIARRQAEIWRDVKNFIANQLVPQSIKLANRSRSENKTAVEIVASIKCYP